MQIGTFQRSAWLAHSRLSREQDGELGRGKAISESQPKEVDALGARQDVVDGFK